MKLKILYDKCNTNIEYSGSSPDHYGHVNQCTELYTTGPLGAISVPYNNAYIKEGLI